MPSAVAKGQYWMLRSRKWLERQGYVVGILQRMQSLRIQGRWIYTKRDTFGADLEAISMERTLFVQVKGGETWRSQLAAARKEFAKYPLGPGCEDWIMGWTPRAREPEIEVVRVGPCAAHQAVRVVPRRRPKVLPLFAAR